MDYSEWSESENFLIQSEQYPSLAKTLMVDTYNTPKGVKIVERTVIPRHIFSKITSIIWLDYLVKSTPNNVKIINDNGGILVDDGTYYTADGYGIIQFNEMEHAFLFTENNVHLQLETN